MTINVLHVCDQLGLGGTERGILAMCRTMRYGIFEHTVYCLMMAGVRAASVAPHAQVVVGGTHGSRELEDLLAARSFDVVMLHRAGGAETRWSSVLSSCREARIPLVLEANIFGRVDRSAEDELIDWHLHISKSSYCNFRKRAEAIGYPRVSRHRVLHIPTDARRIGLATSETGRRQEARRRYRLSADDFVLLRTGRPDFRKWGDLLLEALPLLARRLRGARFVFLSAPATRAWYMARQSFADRVRVLPQTDDDGILADAYAMADVYIHSSRRGESFGVSLVEAMSASLPVVTDSTPWIDNAQVEVVDHDLTGLVANTPEAFASAVEHLHSRSDVRIEMGRRGRNKALAHYDAEIVCRSLSNLIGEGLRRKNPDRGDCGALIGVIEPSMEEIEHYWRTERVQREAAAWDGIPPGRFRARLRQLAWAPLDACEVLASRGRP